MLRGSILAGAALVALAGCSQPEAVVGGRYTPVVLTNLEPIDQLDVLFVIDDSGSMADDQVELVAAARAHLFPQLEGLPYGLPDLHLGVVSTNVGAAGAASVPGCAGAGDDGVLLKRPACGGIEGSFLSDRPAPDGTRVRNYTGTLEDQFSCLATLGASGCGFEQPLGALTRALANPLNDGFLRPDALLLVVIVADEDDCTAFSPDFYGDPTAGVTSPLGPRTSFRCFEFGAACAEPEDRTAGARTACVPQEASPFIRPLGPLVDEVIAAKGGDRAKVMVAGIFGDEAPVEVVLADETGAPSDRPMLAEQCSNGAVTAFAAVRLASFAREFPARFVLPGVCGAGMAKSVAHIGGALSDVLGGGTCALGREVRDPRQCKATITGAGGATRTLHPCRGGDGACLEMVADPVACVASPGNYKAVVTAGAIEPGETLQVDCWTAP